MYCLNLVRDRVIPILKQRNAIAFLRFNQQEEDDHIDLILGDHGSREFIKDYTNRDNTLFYGDSPDFFRDSSIWQQYAETFLTKAPYLG